MKKGEAITGLISSGLGLVLLAVCTLAFVLFVFDPDAFIASFNERILHGSPILLAFIFADMGLIGIVVILLHKAEKK